jgi:GNAT superfamily N-acetyltransferase
MRGDMRLEWDIAYYEPGDEAGIIELYKKVFGEERSLALWKWRFEGLPDATDHITLAKDENGEICGHVAGLPRRVSYRGREVLAGTYVDFMVRPDQAGRGLGTHIAATVLEQTVRKFDLTFSFPNPKSVSSAIRGGASRVGDVPIYWRVESTSAALRGLRRGTKIPSLLTGCCDILLRAFYRLLGLTPLGGRSFACEQAAAFEGNVERLVSTERPGCEVYVLRDEDFLRWRFDRNPETDYTVLFLRNRKDVGGGLLGYAVLAIREYQGFKIGFIVDALIHPHALRPARYLFSQASRWLEERDVEVLSCMMSGHNPYSTALLSLGYIHIPHRYFPRSLNHTTTSWRPDIDQDFLKDLGNWLVTWADTDLV